MNILNRLKNIEDAKELERQKSKRVIVKLVSDDYVPNSQEVKHTDYEEQYIRVCSLQPNFEG